MKRFFLVALALACLLALSGCAEVDGKENESIQNLPEFHAPVDHTESDNVGLRFFALPYFADQTLDPYTCVDGPQQTLGTLLYEGLFTLDGTFTAHSALATGCTDKGGGSYTVTLRPGTFFSDGSALTANDVVYSLNRAKSSGRYQGRLSGMTEVSGEGTAVHLTFSAPVGDLAARLDIPIVKEGTGENLVPVGAGPYAWAQDEQGPYLAKNDRWWRQEELPIERVELKSCKDKDSVAYAFYARDIQLLCADLTGTDTVAVPGSGAYTDAPSTVMQYIGFNTKSGPFADAALRRAVSRGIDRTGCVDAYLLGHGVGTQLPISPASALYPQSLAVDYSPDDYAAAMTSAGYVQGKTREATLVVSAENTFRVQAAQKIAADLSRYDVKITVSALSWTAYEKALKAGDYDLYYGECKLTADWDLTALVGRGGALNFSGFADETMWELMRHCADGQESRADALEALYRRLEEQSPFTPVCFKSMSVLLPTGAVEEIHPTAANPFADLTQWKIHWMEEE